jgi:hypothetical protein
MKDPLDRSPNSGDKPPLFKDVGSITVTSGSDAQLFERYFGTDRLAVESDTRENTYHTKEYGSSIWSENFSALVQAEHRRHNQSPKPGTLRALELGEDMSDSELITRVGKTGVVSLSDIAYLLDQHANGSATPLDASGKANLFLVAEAGSVHIVHGFRNLHGRGWCFESYPMPSGRKWMRGIRVFVKE